jgi:hypothetical protein
MKAEKIYTKHHIILPKRRLSNSSFSLIWHPRREPSKRDPQPLDWNEVPARLIPTRFTCLSLTKTIQQLGKSVMWWYDDMILWWCDDEMRWRDYGLMMHDRKTWMWCVRRCDRCVNGDVIDDVINEVTIDRWWCNNDDVIDDVMMFKLLEMVPGDENVWDTSLTRVRLHSASRCVAATELLKLVTHARSRSFLFSFF